MLRELVLKNRSFRRFREDVAIERSMVEELIDLARCSASGGNVQPLKYYLSVDTETNGRIFPYLAWAGALKDWDGPSEGERPSAYVVILCDTTISKGAGVDHGIAAWSILLGAAERGLGGCMIGSVKRADLHKALGLGDEYEIALVIALGEPGEEVVLEAMGGDDYSYWRDEDGVHHVPKRSLDEIIIS